MNQFKNNLAHIESKQAFAYSLVRIFLGIVLFIRGWIFASNPDAIIALVGEHNLHIWVSYLTIGHLLGGFLLATGLLTRIGALLQIPILLTAVFFVNARQNIMSSDQSLELASLVLFLLVIFLVFGSGSWSLDKYFRI